MISASEASTLMACPERWRRRYWLREPDATTPAQARGLAIHAMYGAMLEGADVGALARLTADPEALAVCTLAAPVLAMPKGWKLEGTELRFETRRAKGYIDALVTAGDGTRFVLELKTTKSGINQFVSKFASSIQAQIYRTEACRFFGASSLLLDVIALPRTRQKNGEGTAEWAVRLAQGCKFEARCSVQCDTGSIGGDLAYLDGLRSASLTLADVNGHALRNPDACFSYGHRCPYFEGCYG